MYFVIWPGKATFLDMFLCPGMDLKFDIHMTITRGGTSFVLCTGGLPAYFIGGWGTGAPGIGPALALLLAMQPPVSSQSSMWEKEGGLEGVGFLGKACQCATAPWL